MWSGVAEAVGTVVNRVITGVLGLFGITPTASGLVANNPLAAMMVSLLGWGTRREAVEQTSVVGPQVASALVTDTEAVAPLGEHVDNHQREFIDATRDVYPFFVADTRDEFFDGLRRRAEGCEWSDDFQVGGRDAIRRFKHDAATGTQDSRLPW